MGFVVLPLKRRHWIAIRKINDSYWNLDSKLDAPEYIGNVRFFYMFSICPFSNNFFNSQEDSLKSYFKTQLQSNDKELFIVVNKETEQNQSWMIHS